MPPPFPRPAPAQTHDTVAQPRDAVDVDVDVDMTPVDGIGNRAIAQALTAEPEEAADHEVEVDVGGSVPIIWFQRNSLRIRRDALVDSSVHVADAISAVRGHLAVVGDTGRVVLHGFASVEGNEPDNRALAAARADRVRDLFVAAGLPRERIVTVAHGEDRTFPGRSWNRRVELELQPTVTDMRFPAETVEARPSAPLRPGEYGALARLRYLADAARKQGAPGVDFAAAVDAFRTDLRARLGMVLDGDPLPADVAIVMRALILWSTDPGNRWGEGIFDSSDVVMTASEYATVPASQYKCNAYVAEVVHRAVGVVHKVRESSGQRGRWFPYQAQEWGDAAIVIPHFPVVAVPQLGDVWSTGSHVGIYLGEYAGKRLYVSARDDGDGVFGLDEGWQAAHGVQIKYISPGGVYRRYTP